MKQPIKEALAKLWHCLRTEDVDGGALALRVVESALGDFDQIEAYGRACKEVGPTIYFLDGNWYGHITEQFSSMCQGESYAEVHSLLAKWCRQEMSK